MFFRRKDRDAAKDAGGEPVFRSTDPADQPAAEPVQPAYDANSLPFRSVSGLNRIHLVFSGRCQGVGFRYTAASIAEQLKLTGWVQNHMDGTVEMEVQGSAPGIKRFITKLFAAYQRYRFAFSIAESHAEDPVDDESGFKVKYSGGYY